MYLIHSELPLVSSFKKIKTLGAAWILFLIFHDFFVESDKIKFRAGLFIKLASSFLNFYLSRQYIVVLLQCFDTPNTCFSPTANSPSSTHSHRRANHTTWWYFLYKFSNWRNINATICTFWYISLHLLINLINRRW